MQTYEIMYILSPRVSDEEMIGSIIEKIESLVNRSGGEVIKTDRWGRRRLAYEINGYTDGFYVLMTFKADSSVASELERILKIAEEVIRHLLVRVGE